MLINKKRGSFVFLAALLTDVALASDPPHQTSHCGTCTACQDACPTQAFPQPGVLDARKCISYLTIELRGPIPENLRSDIGNWIFGCDVCQDVCPWNRRGGVEGLPHDESLMSLDPIETLSMSPAEYRVRFASTALERTRHSGLRRNAAIVLGNVGGPEAIPALEQASCDADELVAEASRWALTRIRAHRD